MSDDRRYTDPATTRLPSTTAPTPTPHRSGWVADPDEPSGWRWIRDLTSISAATHILPTVPTVPTAPATPEGRVDFQGAVDWAWPPDGEDAHLPGDDDERYDGWCEDRSPELGEITVNDGED